MRVSQLLNGEALMGQTVTVSGRLIVSGDHEAFVAESFESFSKHQRVIVRDEFKIGKYLLKVLPAYGGGSCIYDENCTIRGVVQQHGGGYELVAVDSCIVERDDYRIDVPLC
jgi:hypothetical protein